MTKFKSIKVIFAFLILLGLIQPVNATASNKDTVSFKLNLIEKGNEVELSVQGSNITDLYAYDLKIKYDARQLLFEEAGTDIPGFSVDPIQTNDEIRLAHTKVGKVAGDQGDLELFKLKFARVGMGDALFSLSEVKLVDSNMNMETIPATATVTSKGLSATLKDIKGHWAEVAIRQAVGLGLFNGYGDGTFRPNRPLTRTEFVVLLTRALKLDIGVGSGLSFADRSEIPSWSMPYVKAAAEAKLLGGYEDGSFRPVQAITREEMATIIVRILKLNADVKDKAAYTDADSIAAWAEPAVAAVGKEGIMNGRGGKRFEPKANATRAEAVSIVLAILNT